MRLYFRAFIMLVKKFLLRQNTGKVICDFAESMGVVYIKVAQILAMQNYGAIFTETDRLKLSTICDHCNPVAFRRIERQLEKIYEHKLSEIFREIDPTPLGSASISQVHRAVLLDGREVAIKVKRRDVTRRIGHDARQIRRLIHLFGRFAGFRNYLGSDHALELWIDWIRQETDFQREARNLERYQEFAANVNDQVPGTVHLRTPKVYPEYCTDDVLVMEFVHSPTINQLELTPEAKQRVRKSLNDYLRLSFYALLHHQPVVFHGDPHGGNIYLDDSGDLGFLDMGLIFEFSGAESDYVRKLFLYSYLGKTPELVDLILSDSKFVSFDRTNLTADIDIQVKKFHQIPVTQYFVDMVNVFTKYNISPPEATFKMAKAFMALSGISNFTDNLTDTQSLLAAQVTEYYVTRTAEDFQNLLRGGLQILPRFVQTSCRYGLVAGIGSQIQDFVSLHQQAVEAFDNCREIFECLCP